MEEKKLTFAEKHPKLNMLLGLLILLILMGLAVLLLIAIGKGIGSLVGKLAKMDAVVVVALITGGVSITGVILSSIVGKSLEYKKARNEYLAQKREEPYGQFVDMVYKVQQNTKKPNSYTDKEMQKDILKFSRQLTLWGSPKVAKKWKEFKYNSVGTTNPVDNLFVMEEILNEMRNDLGVKKLSKGGILSFFINDIDEVLEGKHTSNNDERISDETDN